jgi:hypothetical protein
MSDTASESLVSIKRLADLLRETTVEETAGRKSKLLSFIL